MVESITMSVRRGGSRWERVYECLGRIDAALSGQGIAPQPPATVKDQNMFDAVMELRDAVQQQDNDPSDFPDYRVAEAARKVVEAYDQGDP